MNFSSQGSLRKWFFISQLPPFFTDTEPLSLVGEGFSPFNATTMPPHTFLSFFLALSLLHPPPRAVALTAPSDVAALAALKAAVLPSSVSPWSCLRTWNFSAADPCASPRRAFFVCGLTCDDDDAAGGVSRVTAIVLDNAGYEGSLSPAVGKLSRLVHLDLSDIEIDLCEFWYCTCGFGIQCHSSTKEVATE